MMGNAAVRYGESGRVFSSRLAWPGFRKTTLVAGVKDAQRGTKLGGKDTIMCLSHTSMA